MQCETDTRSKMSIGKSADANHQGVYGVHVIDLAEQDQPVGSGTKETVTEGVGA